MFLLSSDVTSHKPNPEPITYCSGEQYSKGGKNHFVWVYV